MANVAELCEERDRLSVRGVYSFLRSTVGNDIQAIVLWRMFIDACAKWIVPESIEVSSKARFLPGVFVSGTPIMGCQLLLALILLGDSKSDSSSALEIALAVIDHQDELMASWIVTFTNDIQSEAKVVSPGAKPFRQLQSYRELRRGRLFRIQTELTLNAAQPQNISESLQTFDGEKYRGWTPEDQRGAITSKGREPSCLAQNLYSSIEPLGAMLRDHLTNSDVAWVERGQRRLLAVSWDEAGGVSRRTYYLDPEANYQPLYYTLESEYPQGVFPDSRERGILMGETKDFVRQGDVVLPSVMTITHDETFPDNRVVRTMVKETRITSVSINPELDDTEFTIEFPDGAQVQDKDRKVKYIVGRPGSEEPIDARPADAVPGVAGPAYELWADWRVWTGFSALCLGLLIWAKRRGWA